MKIRIEINCENAAFEDNAGGEVKRILNHLGDVVNGWPGNNFFIVGAFDINGNRVGQMEAEENNK